MPRPALHPAGPTLAIPDHELVFRASRAGGPGGQHVNKASTRVEVLWNVQWSVAPTDAQRARLLRALRVDSEGWLRVVSASSRSQTANREDATRRLLDTVARALRIPKRRRQTAVPAAERERRLEQKRRRARAKRERRTPYHDE